MQLNISHETYEKLCKYVKTPLNNVKGKSLLIKCIGDYDILLSSVRYVNLDGIEYTANYAEIMGELHDVIRIEETIIKDKEVVLRPVSDESLFLLDVGDESMFKKTKALSDIKMGLVNLSGYFNGDDLDMIYQMVRTMEGEIE